MEAFIIRSVVVFAVAYATVRAASAWRRRKAGE